MDFGLVREREASASHGAVSGQESGGHATPGHPALHRWTLRGRLRELRESVWLPVALRMAGTGLLMLVLAGIGAASMLAAPPGVKLDAALPLAAQAGSAWLLPASSSSARVAPVRPRAQIAACVAGEPCASDAGSSPPGLTPDGKVILNAATVDDLVRLPGIGRRRAEAIVELRKRLKRFRTANDLLRVRGIGPKSLKRMLPHFVIDAPAH